MNAAAWNQRNAFQNQARVVSFASPAAAIGVVATITISAAARVSITSTCAIAAIQISRPITPSTVAVAGVGDLLGVDRRPRLPGAPAGHVHQRLHQRAGQAAEQAAVTATV